MSLKITLKASERRHLTTSNLPEVTVQNHVLDHGNIIYVLLYFHAWTVFPRIYTNLQSGQTICNFSNSRPIYVTLWEMRNHYRNTWFMKISKCRHFLFLKKQPQKWTKFSTFYLIFKGSSFQYHKVRHPNFQWYTTPWNGFLKFELKKSSFFINLLAKVS